LNSPIVDIAGALEIIMDYYSIFSHKNVAEAEAAMVKLKEENKILKKTCM